MHLLFLSFIFIHKNLKLFLQEKVIKDSWNDDKNEVHPNILSFEGEFFFLQKCN